MSEFRERLKAGLRHAFDLGAKGPVEPTPSQRATIERVLAIVVKRRMTGPATLFLESARPLNGVGASAIRFFEPIASALVDQAALRDMADYLQNRGAVDWLLLRLEVMEREAAGSSLEPERGDRGSK